MKILAKFKMISSFTLLCCIFLPLARCSESVGTQHNEDLYIYGEQFDVLSILPILSWTLPLLLMVAALKFRNSIVLSLLEMVSGFGAAYIGFWILLWADVLLWAGYVAAMSIVIYCISCFLNILIIVRRRYRIRLTFN